MEVAVKMGLRASCDRFGWDASQEQIGILGLKGSYHGDTIGVQYPRRVLPAAHWGSQLSKIRQPS
jgi:hypothetical protein